MDLAKVINSINSNILELISRGFANSQFVDREYTDLGIFVKDILAKLLYDEGKKQKIYTQLQSGILANKRKDEQQSKKQSFCTDFNSKMYCILGLIGFEMCKYITFISKTNDTLQELTNSLANITSYSDLNLTLLHIRNILEFVDEDTTDIDNIINDIKTKINTRNIHEFETNKTNINNMIIDIISLVNFTEYTIDSIYDLCIVLGNKNICYDNSFISVFYEMHKEAAVDEENPFINYILNVLKMESAKTIQKQLDYFKSYYRTQAKNILECIETPIKINITDEFLDEMANITFGLFVYMTKKLSDNQLADASFGKSTRIQFIQIFKALMACAPRCYNFTDDQLSTLHFILMSQTDWNNSIKTLCIRDY